MSASVHLPNLLMKPAPPDLPWLTVGRDKCAVARKKPGFSLPPGPIYYDRAAGVCPPVKMTDETAALALCSLGSLLCTSQALQPARERQASVPDSDGLLRRALLTSSSAATRPRLS